VTDPGVTPRGGMSERSDRRGIRLAVALEWTTLLWNVVGVVVLAVLAWSASSVALAGFGLDSLIEIGASAVVLWELRGTDEVRRRRALRLIGLAFVLLAGYLAVQSIVALVTVHRPAPSLGGIIWTAVTAAVMFALAAGKSAVGRRIGNEVVVTEGRVTLIDGILAASVLAGLLLDAVLGWWWTDAVVGVVIVFYAVREAVHIFREG
jgi:divalent metal cation (Fe/Co/Zn/Cd) transporter